MEPKPTTEKPICVPREIVLKAAMIRLGEVDDEIQAGYNIIRRFHKTVTIFGSARAEEYDESYKKARQIARQLAEEKYTVITGGGHGIMEAANRGAHDAGKDSVGFNITLPHEQTLNKYATISYGFAHFAPRKIVMTLYADAYIYFPGGYGTLDELSEILTLIQTGKTPRAPIILVGSDFWKEFDDFIEKAMLHEETISNGDEKLYMITDDIDTVIDTILANKTYCNH